MTNSILEARNLRKQFGGILAVDDVSLQVAAGSVHAIIGPNGAGKTTFFNLLTGRYTPTQGQIIFKGQDITHLPVHRRAALGMGRSFQITNIFPNLTVIENVRLAAQVMGSHNLQLLRRADALTEYIDRAAEMLKLVGLAQEMGMLASTLPHGGKRKLELAIILASDPELMLLDEPTTGMASEQVPELIETIRAVRERENKTIVLVEHNMRVVMDISDRITVMNLGQVLAEGTPTEITNNPTVHKVYLGELYGSITEM
ncbi:MAG: ABC transporter ATP-binding protein [Anaerolineae bacterium]|nr:ABC transporter ATP-binding protein [Anaerolineae bacterium]